jgi:hypothetical protein
MKSAKEDGGECWRKWYRTRRVNLLRLSGEVPKTLCIDQIHLIICFRYAGSLVGNQRVTRFLAKHHPSELQELREFVVECEGLLRTPGETQSTD